MRVAGSHQPLLQVWCYMTNRKHTVSDAATEEYVRYCCREATVGTSKTLYSFKTCEMNVLALRDDREYLISTGDLKAEEVRTANTYRLC